MRGASNVFEVERRDKRWPPPGPRLTLHVSGEAAFLDPGGGRNALALLAHGDNAEWADKITS